MNDLDKIFGKMPLNGGYAMIFGDDVMSPSTTKFIHLSSREALDEYWKIMGDSGLVKYFSIGPEENSIIKVYYLLPDSNVKYEVKVYSLTTCLLTSDKILFREHRGGLEDSMKTLKSFNNRDELVEYCKSILDKEFDEFEIKPYGGPDARIGWDATYMVVVDGCGLVGYINKMC